MSQGNAWWRLASYSLTFRQDVFSKPPVGSPIPLGPGRSSGRLARLLKVAHRRKDVRIVPKGLSEKAENLVRRVVILGEAYQREDVPWRILVKTTAVGEDEYKAVAEELVEAGLAERVDGDYAGLRATPAGKERVRGPHHCCSVIPLL